LTYQSRERSATCGQFTSRMRQILQQQNATHTHTDLISVDCCFSMWLHWRLKKKLATNLLSCEQACILFFGSACRYMTFNHVTQSRKVHLSMQDPKLGTYKHPCALRLWREVPSRHGGPGWKSLPENRFSNAPLWFQQLTRGVCNNIGDIMRVVRGGGAGVRF